MLALPASNRPSLSFPKTSRLLQRQDFIRLSQLGTKQNGRHFIMLMAEAVAGRRRLGITVSKKVGCAVVRNRVKRRLREAFRLTQSEWPEADIVVIARSSAANLTTAQVQAELLQLLQRIRGR